MAKDIPPGRQPVIRDALLLSAAYALLFIALESLKAHRSRFWTGMTWLEFGGSLCGMAVYFAGLLVLTLAVLTLARRLFARPRLRPFAAIPSAAAASTILWACLSVCRTEYPTFDDLFVVTLILGVGTVSLISRATGLLPLGRVCALAALTFLATIAATVFLSQGFFLHPQRTELVTRLTVGWMVAFGVIAFAVAVLFRHARRQYVLAVVGLVVGAGAPALVAALASQPTLEHRSARQRNLVLITCDALRADYCSAYGGSTPTPTLEALADRGVLFTRSYSLAPWTVPSMLGMFSSTHPRSLSSAPSREAMAREVGRYRWDPKHAAFAERLSANGYMTGGFVGNRLLHRRDGILRGFDQTRWYLHWTPERRGLFGQFPFLRDCCAWLVPALVHERPVDTSRVLTCHAEEFISRNRNMPFFLWIHYMDPHDPYDPPARFRTRAGPWPVFSPSPRSPRTDSPKFDDAHYLQGLTEDDKAYIRSLYEGEIRYVDECIGRVVAQIDRLGLDDVTCICVTSDHGEAFWERGRTGHAFSLHEEQVHVPLVFAGPGIGPATVDVPVSALDLMPTLADWIEVDPLVFWRGRSLMPLLNGEPETEPRPCFANATNHYAWPDRFDAAIGARYKLIRSLDSNRVELFDLVEDPLEQHDVADAEPALAGSLPTELTEWSNSFDSSFTSRDMTPEEEAGMQERIQVLRSIGYVD